jgi:rod shape-determining protein MreD
VTIKILLGLLISIFASLLEGRYPYLFTIADVTPNIALVWVIILSLRTPVGVATVIGFAVGLLTDMWGEHNLGSHSLMFSVVCFMASSLKDRFYIHSIWAGGLAVALISPIGFAIDIVFRFIFVPGFTLTFWGVLLVLLRAIYNAAIALVLYPLLDGTIKWLTERRA